MKLAARTSRISSSPTMKVTATVDRLLRTEPRLLSLEEKASRDGTFTLVDCLPDPRHTTPEEEMISAIGSTLVGTGITRNPQLQRRLLDAVHIDRLNLGPVPTIKLNWLQPHEGNIIDFLFRARAYQEA